MNASAVELTGMLAGCGAAALALVASDRRLRLAALAVAIVLAPVLVAGDVWNEERVVRFRDDPAMVAAAAIAAAIAIAALAALIRRLPLALPVLVFALLPLRIPVEIGGETANLLIPLYVVIASGAVAAVWRARAGSGEVVGDSRLFMKSGHASSGSRPASFHENPGLSPPASPAPARVVTWLRWALAATLVVYAVQTAYSDDVSNAIENAGFFLIPFAAMFVLLAEIRWTRRLLGVVLAAVGAMATVFAIVAIYQYAARDLFLNSELFDSNQLHLYFRVNSLFFDPNILGRYLALALTALAAYLAWGTDRRWLALAAAASGLVVAGLAFSFSITSFVAALAGLGALAILRWRWRGAVGAGGLALAGLAVFALAGGTPGSEIDGDGRDIEGGRDVLITGGLELAEDRPVAGWGAGSFGRAFFEQTDNAKRGETTVSHAEPVTVAAEQGAVGLTVYLALVGLALVALLGGRLGASGARAAVAACFVTMLVHSLGYAGFAIDPATWALLTLGVGLRGGVADG